jgi:hypothetical protein
MRMNDSQTGAIPHGDWCATPGNRLPPSFALKRDRLALRFEGELSQLLFRTSRLSGPRSL